MTNEEILDGNLLIAAFHGATFNGRVGFYLIKPLSFMGSLEEMKYHTSWDWLMPVVEKINSENINTGKRIDFTPAVTSVEMSFYVPYEVSMWNETGWSIVIKEDTPIQSLWLAVVEFIKWYNEQ